MKTFKNRIQCFIPTIQSQKLHIFIKGVKVHNPLKLDNNSLLVHNASVTLMVSVNRKSKINHQSFKGDIVVMNLHSRKNKRYRRPCVNILIKKIMSFKKCCDCFNSKLTR